MNSYQLYLFTVLICITFSINSVYAQDSETVTFFEIKTDIAFKQATVPHEVSRDYIQIHTESIQSSLMEGTVLDFSLGDSEHLFEIQRVNRYTDNTKSVIAKASNGQRDYLVFTIEEEQVSGKLHLNQFEDLYYLEFDRELQSNYIMEVSSSELDVLYCEADHQYHEIEELFQGLPDWEFDMSRSEPDFEESSGTTDVDIMIVYTQRANSWMNNHSSRNQVIAQAMNLSQMVMDNSQIPVNLNLVHTHQTSYDEDDDEDSAELLKRFSASPSYNPWGDEFDGYMEEIHAIRDEVNADLVALFARVSNWGGRGWTRPLRPELGFSVNRVQQMDVSYTLVHEFGHNFGSEHSRNQESAPARGIGHRDYSTGWRWTGNDGNGYVSVMTYGEGDERVPYFSNPDINYQGVPTGSYSGEFAPADNARSIRETRDIIAAYRTEAPDPPSVPILASPSNGSTGQNRSPELRWSASSRGEQYRIQVSESSDFNNIKIDNRTTDVQLEVSINLDYKTTYYWRVRAENEGGNSNWSNTWNFTTVIAPPEAVALISPENSSESISIQPEFEWEESERAEQYRIQLSESSNFNNLILDSETTNLSYVSSNGLDYSTTYYWRIRSENKGGNSNWSDAWNFTTKIAPPETVTMISPVNNSESESTETIFEWNKSDRTDNYNLQISKNQDFTSLVYDEELTETFFEVPSPLLYQTSYFWRVIAENSTGKSDWSDVWSFETENFPIPENFALIKEDDNVKLEWDSVESQNIISYWIYRGESTSSLDTLEAISAEFTTYNDDPVQTSFYAVKAEYSQGDKSEFSDVVGFIVDNYVASDRWELISLPLKSSELQLPMSQIFSFDRIYQRSDVVYPGYGVWVRSDENEQADINGEALLDLEIDIQTGWNLIGSLADEISVTAIDDPGELLSEAPIYEYRNGVYQSVESIQPGNGYWIHANETGSIKLNHQQPNALKEVRDHRIAGNFHQLEISTNGITQDFWISDEVIDDNERIRYLMPPLAPEPILDMRSTSGFQVADNLPATIELRTSGKPVQISISLSESSQSNQAYRLVDRIDGNDIYYNLSDQPITVHPSGEIIYLEKLPEEEIVNSYKLHQNYPNPFNPTTNIQYELPFESSVQLDVYDITGRHVAALVEDAQQAGVYTVQFDGSNQASGVYFVRLQAGSFSQIQKITLIR
ncbi:MAG: T9SS type A sorting domain-containing protein [Balneolaceae bacterium]|nr:T9SS type A sorting domain-containing protein [Balneolaceae bacterium]